ISPEVDLLGEKLGDEGISYIGNDSSAILAANKSGSIRNGEISIEYNEEWLKEKTNFYLKDSNILIMSYQIDGSREKFKVLNDYIEGYESVNFIVFPKEVPKEMQGMLNIVNRSLVPIVYKESGKMGGVLTSSSTRREGLITSLDIFPEILSIYNESSRTAIGKRITSITNENPLEFTKNFFKETVNLTWITYALHGIAYYIQALCTYYFIKNRKDKFNDILLYYNFVIINILMSFLLGFTTLNRNVFLYLAIILMFSYPISLFITTKKLNPVGTVSTITYILMVIGIIFYPKFIYNSYIGYDNLIYGARYYGFNNGAMAVLLATSIISYFSIVNRVNRKILKDILLLVYFSLNILVLSVKFGANTGGFFTAIILLLTMIYLGLLNRKLSFKNVIILGVLGFIILFFNMYFDINSIDRSHAGNLIYRMKFLGKKEFLDMIGLKLKEIAFMVIIPPWNIVLVTQILLIKNFWEKHKRYYHNIDYKRPVIKKEYTVFLITGIVAFFSNDTGIIAFVYLLQYLIVNLMNLYILD
ncbi:MAG TPA: hypothetical protein VK071_12695, partial [Tissierellales bacterium]|nr:hypothetical protein [Tissierellales bacterium]